MLASAQAAIDAANELMTNNEPPIIDDGILIFTNFYGEKKCNFWGVKVELFQLLFKKLFLACYSQAHLPGQKCQLVCSLLPCLSYYTFKI